MKNRKKAGGRRAEMNVKLGAKTIERFSKLYADGDYAEIDRMVTEPPTTRVTIAKYLQQAAKDSETTMPYSIAKAAQDFYLKKEKAVKELAA